MKICFPVEQSEGMQSKVFGHFGSAPVFVVVDTEAQTVSEIVNRDLNHQHGACSPIKALGGADVNAVVVGGIGGGALMKLQEAGLKVYRAGAVTISENVSLMQKGMLQILQPHQVCGGHAHGGGCAH